MAILLLLVNHTVGIVLTGFLHEITVSIVFVFIGEGVFHLLHELPGIVVDIADGVTCCGTESHFVANAVKPVLAIVAGKKLACFIALIIVVFIQTKFTSLIIASRGGNTHKVRCPSK